MTLRSIKAMRMGLPMRAMRYPSQQGRPEPGRGVLGPREQCGFAKYGATWGEAILDLRSLCVERSPAVWAGCVWTNLRWSCDPGACCGRVADPVRGLGQAGLRRGRGGPDRAGPGRAGPYIYRDIPWSGWVGQRNTGQEDRLAELTIRSCANFQPD